MADEKTYLFEKPVPDHATVVRELKVAVRTGLQAGALRQVQNEKGNLSALIQLASVAVDADTEIAIYERLTREIAEAARAVAPEDLRDSAVALVGSPGSRGLGITARRARAADALGMNVDSWEGRQRKDIFDAMAANLRRHEEEFRAEWAQRQLASGEPVPTQLAVDWLDYLRGYRALAEQLDALHADLITWNWHQSGERPISHERFEDLLHTSLFRLATFELRYYQFHEAHDSLFLFVPEVDSEQVEDDLWVLRLSARMPEHVLAWLALAANSEPFPNPWSFRQRLATESEGEPGNLALARWRAAYTRCKCREEPWDEECDLHRIFAICRSFLDVEQSQRAQLLPWFRNFDNTAGATGRKRERTLAAAQMREGEPLARPAHKTS